MFKFRKIASVLASAIMVSSTVALAAAANYPAPFIKSGASDVAIVYGSAQVGGTDILAASDISTNLQLQLAQQTAVSGTSSSSASVSGEAAPLFTSSSNIFLNDSLNSVKSALTKSDLPTVLADGTFEGNVESKYTQTITLGNNPQVSFGKYPTSDNDPNFGLSISSNSANAIYNATVNFNKAVNMSSADSKGQDLLMFGQKFTIASATDGTNLVLLKESQKVTLDSTNSKSDVSVGGKKYTIELISASTTSATIKVTDEAGNSDSKEISENASKKIQGLTVAVTNADSNNLKYTASILAGAEKVTLTDGNSVTLGDDNTPIEGTLVSLVGGTNAITKLTIGVVSSDSNNAAIVAGGSLTDPVFGSFKLDFPSVSVDMNSTARETIAFENNGDDKLNVDFMNKDGVEKSIQFAKNYSGGAIKLEADNDGHNITVMEGQAIYKRDYIVVGNEAEGHLLKLTTMTNSSSTSYSDDSIIFTDAFSGDTYSATINSEGTAQVTVGGKMYSITYNGVSTNSDAIAVRVNSPDSSGSTSAVAYPTIQTSQGAKLAFYKPLTIDTGSWDGSGADLNTLRFPDGDGYTDVTIVPAQGATAGDVNISGTLTNASTAYKAVTIGPFTYNFTSNGANVTTVYLVSPAGGNVYDAAVEVFEAKDDNSVYNGLVEIPRGGASSTTGIGVSNIARSWGSDNLFSAVTKPSNTKLSQKVDLFGSVITLDTSDSAHPLATISYPAQQVSAQLYIGQNSAEITGGVVSGGSATVKNLGNVIITDAEAASTGAGKNLIVIGGSCVNSVAASLLGSTSPVCGADFTTKTNVTSGQFLIQTFARGTDKVATLVAGYNAADTTAAAKYLKTGVVDTTTGAKQVKTSTSTAAVV
jgi:hypothetical protein